MRASWLEPHDQFEGVGAHELNQRYDHVDGDDWDVNLRSRTLLHTELARVVPAFVAAQGFFAANVATAPPRLDGADLSHHQDDQGPILWDVLRHSTWWVATKATQSTTYVDPTFGPHRLEMATGFVQRVYYHWLSSTTDPVAQAEHFIRTVGPLRPGEGLMIDDEEGGVTVAKTLAFAEPVEDHYHLPLICYSGAFVAGGTIWQSPLVRESKYGHRPMHLAAYTTEAKARALPGVAAHPWDGWQFSSNGPVPGVVGRCDMNRIDVRASYDLACGLFAPPIPHPGDDDMKLTAADIYKAEESPGDKFVLMFNGRLRPVSEVELRTLGIPLTIELGTAINKSDRDALGKYVDSAVPVVNVTVDAPAYRLVPDS